MVFQSKKGFTLIEVVVSIGIVSTILFALLALFPFSLRLNRASANLTQATYLAQAGMEQMLSFSYDDINNVMEPKNKLSNDPNNVLYNFEREIEATYLDQNLNISATDQGLKKITSTVYWYNPMNTDEQTYTLTTLISNY